MRAASDVPFTIGWHELGDGAWAYLQPDGVVGLSNAGLVVGDGASLLIDTLFDLKLAEAMLDAISPILDEYPLTAAVNTHANPDHTFGNQLLPATTEIWSSQAGAGEFDDYPPEVMEAMRLQGMPTLHSFNFAEVVLRRPDRTFHGVTQIDVGDTPVELIEVGPAHTKGDVIVYAGDAGVVYTGDILFIGVLPMMWEGPLRNWIAALHRIIALKPRLVVPGHGPVTDTVGVRSVLNMFYFLRDAAELRHSRGMSAVQAVEDIGPEPFDGMLESERVLNLVDMIYRDIDPAHTIMDHPEANANMSRLADLWTSKV
jgi:glyoxylase-like metal-dependent hydrolase (beta-lactamase superfamily II)